MITNRRPKSIKSKPGRRGVVFMVAIMAMLLVSHFYFDLTHEVYAQVVQGGHQSYDVQSFKKYSGQPLVIFPQHFNELVNRFGNEYDINLNTKHLNFTRYYEERFNITNLDSRINIVRYNGDSTGFHDIFAEEFKNHTISFLNATVLEDTTENCKDSVIDKVVQISEYSKIKNELNYLVKVFNYQLKYDPAFADLKVFMADDIGLLFKQNQVKNHFSKFDGTSVWLEQFGVHFMISGVSYSQSGNKDEPTFSLVYAQIFDAHWNELRDVELIMPTIVNNKPNFKRLKFPSFLPIPFFKGYHQGLYYGIEDPKMLLIRNSFGFDEPLIVFNSLHRKIEGFRNEANRDDLTQEVLVDLHLFRSMFICYPFQYDYGMPANLNGIMNPKYENILFSKVITLERPDITKKQTENNWTPFVNTRERINGVDTHIYFVYSWANLQILKCELNTFGQGSVSNCESYYQMNDQLVDNAEAAALRGGTELINLNQYLPHIEVDAWFGLARAHIMDCGCGYDMYRPNFAIIIKDEVGNFEISYLSSFVSFDIPVYGFNESKIQCDKSFPNALIPNGFSNWVVSDPPEQFSSKTNDYLAITFSVADSSNYIVTMKNFLTTINEMVSNHGTNQAVDDNVVGCTLSKSFQFCEAYGNQLRETSPEAFNY